MEGPVCLLWKAKRTAAWYQLSQEEAADLLVKDGQAVKSVGGRNVITCDSRWSSAQWEMFGIDEYPDLDAIQAYTQAMEEIRLFQYWDIEFTVATKVTTGDDGA